MKDKKDHNQKFYFNPISNGEAFSSFEDAVKQSLKLTIWQQGEGDSNVEEYELKGIDIVSKLLTFERPKGFIASLTKSNFTGKKVLFKVIIDKYQFFSSGLLQFSEKNGNYTLQVQGTVYKSQQRSNYRLMATDMVKIQFKVDDQVFDALDISAGGTSFIVHKSEVERFTKGAIFENCKLRLNKNKYSVPKAEVVGIWEQKDAKGESTDEIKLGINFKDLPKHIEEDLFKEINAEARVQEIQKNLIKPV